MDMEMADVFGIILPFVSEPALFRYVLGSLWMDLLSWLADGDSDDGLDDRVDDNRVRHNLLLLFVLS